MKTVAILCAGSPTAYDEIEGVEVFNRKRDARTFEGGMPVVAHPPCRSWSATCGHQAKPDPGERDLALWCVRQVREHGGILEQPQHSRLWDAANITKPGHARRTNEDGYSIAVWQAWWGYPMRKATWLYLVGIDPAIVQAPLILTAQGFDRRREQVMSHRQRSATPILFAQWLVDLARKSKA